MNRINHKQSTRILLICLNTDRLAITRYDRCRIDFHQRIAGSIDRDKARRPRVTGALVVDVAMSRVCEREECPLVEE